MEALRKVVTGTQVLSALEEGVKFIGTHHGTFHCDEALAIAMLKMYVVVDSFTPYLRGAN